MEIFNIELTNIEAKKVHFVAELLQQSESRLIKDSLFETVNKILNMIEDTAEYKAWSEKQDDCTIS